MVEWKKNTQAQRFKYMRETLLNMSQAKLAAELDENTPNIINIEHGRTQKLNNELLKKLSSQWNINIEWLLWGEGNPTKLDYMKEAEFKFNDKIYGIPFYTTKEKENLLTDKDVLYFDTRWIRYFLEAEPDNLALFYAQEDFMDGGDKSIKNGDLLLIDTSAKTGNNKIFVIKDRDDKIKIGKLKWNLNGTFEILCNNSKYKEEFYDVCHNHQTVIEIIGKVVWNGSRKNV